MLSATCALVLLIGAPVEPPAVVVMADPHRTLPKLKGALQWFSPLHPRLAPSYWKRQAAPLRIDPFVPEQWSKVGVNSAAPFFVWVPQPNRRPIFQVQLAGEPHLPQARAVNDGWVLGRPARLVLAKDKDRLLATTRRRALLPAKEGQPRLERSWVEVLRGQGRTVRLPKPATPPADLQVHINQQDAINAARIAVTLKPNLIELQGSLHFIAPVTTQLQSWIGETGAVPLVALPSDLVAGVAIGRGRPKAILSDLEMERGLKRTLTRFLDGRWQVLLTVGGSLIVAVGLRRALPSKQQAILQAGLTQTHRDLKRAVVAPKRLIVWFEGQDANQLRPHLETAAPLGAPESGARLTAYPPRLTAALSARAKSDGPRPHSSVIPLLRIGYGDLLAKTSTIVMALTKVTRGFDLTSRVVRGNAGASR